MGKNTRFVGLDVHAETIAVAVAEGRNRARSLRAIANRPEAARHRPTTGSSRRICAGRANASATPVANRSLGRPSEAAEVLDRYEGRFDAGG